MLAGDLSLVGSRPTMPEETDQYGAHARRRLAVKPGITGLWRVNGASDLSPEDDVGLDLPYVENWSFMLDLQIWETWSAVVGGAGACYARGHARRARHHAVQRNCREVRILFRYACFSAERAPAG